jgi:tRNA A37 methylthiotransferase MiaB
MYPELIYEIKTNSKVRYIGIEIQTASNPLLKLMGRNHTVEDCTHVMTQLKENPNSLIYTILMSSFPTETVQDLDDTINYVIRNNIFVEDICEYSDSIYIPSHRLGPMTEKESKDHYEYLCTFMGEYKKNWLYNNTKKVKEAMIIARGGEVTIFDISVPTVRGMSESERFLDVPVGSIIIPQSVEPTFTEKGKLICKIK